MAEITFNFWFVLSNEVAGSGKMLTDVQKAECKTLFAPLFLQLVDGLRNLVRSHRPTAGGAVLRPHAFARRCLPTVRERPTLR